MGKNAFHWWDQDSNQGGLRNQLVDLSSQQPCDCLLIQTQIKVNIKAPRRRFFLFINLFIYSFFLGGWVGGGLPVKSRTKGH